MVKNPTDEELAAVSHVCVGSLQHANASHKLYKNPELRKMQDAVGENPDILNYREFEGHHGNDPLKLLAAKQRKVK